MSLFLDLHKKDLLDLTDAGALAAFFERLGYTVDRLEQSPENLGVTAEANRRPIRRVERLVKHGDPFLPIEVYLFELTKLTLTHTRALAKAFRDRAGFFLLVLTSDWQRLDFVYVEVLPPDPDAPSKGLGGSERARVRPRILTVDRRDPHRVALRVLRRLRWSSEDNLAQKEKILAAYNVGDWSEKLFNNRALFSDHYLTHSLPEDPAWREDPKPVWNELRQSLRDVGDRLPGRPTAEMRAEFLGSTLRTLGFYFNARRGTAPPKGRKETGYRLYAADGTAVAICLDCPWGRYLDGKDGLDEEDPEDNPSVRVAQAFEPDDGKTGVDWVILTNGQLWRLYGRRAHSRTAHYYEIDLPELFVPGDARDTGDAFRFFWLLFRCQSFERQKASRDGRERDESLVDRLLLDSREYAKKLGDRLKETIFDDVFSELAKGFLRSVTDPDEIFSQEQLDDAFRGTLAFLYRSLFLLYAEARNLLPVHEVRDYLAISLKGVRDEVAAAGGVAESERDRKLAERYDAESFMLYERLQRLFRVIDQGDPAVNVPTYNGGLFVSDPKDADLSAEAAAARFLLRARVDDLTLARALDRLARAEEEKRAELVFIDYRSLGVRQLGSIYEGLLEFRLRVAREEMAVVALKKKSGKRRIEKTLPLSEARDEKKYTVLRAGRGKDAAERILHPGDVYLENDKGERKSTGSYYTPDFVVEYLVARTLEPLLAEKLDALRPALREAESWHRKMKEMAPRKGEPEEKYVSGPAVDHRWQDLVEDFFDLKVLDPAMGSGHFLVEAVDFITDRMVRFLSGFKWNPVFAYLDSTRRTITAAMGKQEIVILDERLDDLNLLKRHVLKRCIYGVDVNPMAVELAKVSLWLDCFTLGAPLSFLDHHLRCGNSLLGVTIESVDEALKEKQLTFTGSRFSGLLQATMAMIKIGTMPDVTAEQVQESRSEYRSASHALVRFRRRLDVWCSQWFVEPPAAAAPSGSVANKRRKKPLQARVVEYLKAESIQKFLAIVDDEETFAELAQMEAVDRDYLQDVLREARDRRFFHWEIEFPEVFYRRKPGTERQLERAHGREFDAVVGNPPWIRQEGLKDLKKALKAIFKEVYVAEADIYVYLVARSLQILRHRGRFGMILQNKWFKAEYAQTFREHLSERSQPLEVVDFGHAPLFPDADTFPCTLLVLKPADEPEYQQVDFFVVTREDLRGIDLEKYGADTRSTVPRQRLRKSGWELLPQPVGDLMEKIRSAGVPLREFSGSSPFYGVKTGFNEAFFIDQLTRDELVESDRSCEGVIKPFLRGEDIRRWHSPWGGEWIILLKSSSNHEWRWSNASSNHEAEKSFKANFPSIYKWMKSHEGRLRTRQDKGRYWWELRACDYYDVFERPRICYQDLAFHSEFSLEDGTMYANNTCYMIPEDSRTLLATLNSSLAWFYFGNTTQPAKDGTFRLHSIYLDSFPVAQSPQEHAELEDLVCAMLETASAFLKHEDEYHSLANVTSKRSKNAHAWKLAEEAFRHRFKKQARCEELLDVRRPLRGARKEMCDVEIKIQKKIFALFGLTPEDVTLLRRHSPPRDPLTIAEQDLRLLQDD